MKMFVGCALGLAVAIALVSCKKESPAPPPPSQPPASAPAAGGSITIEYETLPSILFEAESGAVTPPVAIFEDAKASGGKYALAPEGPDHQEISIGGDVTYSFTVETPGEYTLWLRAHWVGACGNSLGVILNGQDLGNVGDAVYEVWHWVPLGRKRLTLAAGEQTLTIVNREDGSAWDQVLLAADPEYRPADIEKGGVKGRVVFESCLPSAPAGKATAAP